MERGREEKATGVRTWKNVRALAATEFKRTWPSYLTTALVTVLTGAIGAASVAEVFPVDGRRSETGLLWAADFLLLCLGTGLAYNWAASGYWHIWRDPFAERLSFLRGLPVPVRELVRARMLIMLICLPVFSSLFFLPTYVLLSSLPGPSEPVTFLWFVLTWAGYGLFSGGLMLWVEMGFRGRTAYALLWLWLVVLVVVIVVAVFVLRESIVLGTADLARAYGPLPAALSLLVGAVAFASLGLLAERRLSRRELV